MLRSITKEAKTVDEAIRQALEELGIDKDQAEIEIISEGNKGLLGLIGSKNAVVKVTEKLNIELIVQEFLEPIFEKMAIEADMEITMEDGQMNIRLTGDDIGIVIGRRGETLDALQYLLSLVINRYTQDYTRVILDVADYRKKRAETLQRLARRVAEKVSRTRRNITLEAMNPYERRIIHSSLQGFPNVDTHSVGEEPNRKVVIRYAPGSGK
ncbi:MAG TPA: RNA-binding cell elongation regulator Jag/EloR [Thermoclostridium caenicola]|uniref:RNA-binding protein KhpB n=1 Tax=Thermoclostridium caenicola TaxID=659425 RepID=A0A1M6J9U8_9FIRM|nr:RNA-binding cell elongation regulator Jag/EloR [Thermoclostridium caenicola]SHJ43485.1 spoIIIJ-associated protein [Thermoclostridium caenicola]HOK42540.1 RNA-binding cell elongation regulator Jag/EloR [Thermoclostridium caenicola]HOL84268.1 RNA-binding cell elongation regulator Jag/EloR [Thermoclostridium caenicola]HPO76432.1 RNA-binding cell elongation regulator Jag/EloR [Thermoclostridium caenicola]HPU22399.1 RNA-binding cell elongation regulator Jag/EloR [Thermoclostridium caenicola]